MTTLSDACVREFWAAVIPLTIVRFLFALPPPFYVLFRILRKPFTNFLPLHEAEALDAGKDVVEQEGETSDVKLWRTLVLSTVSLVETLLWAGIGGYSFIVNPEDTWNGLRDLLVAATWFYATLRPVIWPTAMTPYDLFSLFTAHFLLGVVILFGRLYDQYVYGIPMPNTLRLTVYIINLVAVASVLILVLNMPMGVPSKRVKKEDIVSCSRVILSIVAADVDCR